MNELNIITANLCLESEYRSASNWANFLSNYDLVAIQESIEVDSSFLGVKIADILDWYYHPHFDVSDTDSDFDQCIISPHKIPYYVKSIHLSNTKDTFGRLEELKKTICYDDLIVMGDFNEDLSGETHKEMKNKGFHLVEIPHHTHPTPMFKEYKEKKKLDFIYLKEFREIDAKVIDSGLSDHYCVSAVITI